MQKKLMGAVSYVNTLRGSDDPVAMEGCEKAIRYANCLSLAILALNVEADQ